MKSLSFLSYANVTATIALVVALGGTGYAATRIGTDNIEDGAVTSAKLANGAVTANKIAAKAVTPKAVNGSERFPIKVNDAKTLNGISSNSFIRGHMASGVFSTTSATPETVATVEGFGKVGVGCEKSEGFARFTNTSGKPIVVTIDSSSAPLRSATVDTGKAINGPTSTKPQLQTWRIRLGDETKNTVATIWITFVGGTGKSCAGSAQALKKD